MESTPSTDQAKQLRLSIFINLAMAIYAICTFIKALQTHVAWRIIISGVGSVFFVAMLVILVLRLVKLRKAG
jgi:hypothetical protein